MTATNCPTSHALRQYLLGDCSDDLSVDIEQHLTDCSACEATLAEFDTADDTLLRHLPLAAAPSLEVLPPAGWIDILRQRPPSGQLAELPSAHQSPQTIAEPALADGFANYQVRGILGRGGMGVVFLARHKQLQRQVALKVIRPDALSSVIARKRFQREIQILGGLHHAGIVMATDAGIVGRGAYLVMELIDGVDFGRLVRQTGPLTIETACEVGRQIAEALASAHAGGVIHRDVKPSNIMADVAGRVRLLDFGLAHMTRVMQESGDTSIGRLLGTLDYMAPEQAEGEQQIDARTDLYGRGALLFFLLAGQPPHGVRNGRSILEQIRTISQEAAPPISSLRVGIPPELNQLMAQLLSRPPQDRPASAADVAMQLSQWSGGDLAARVTEYKTQATASTEEAADGGAAAQLSLAELLGTDISHPSIPAALPRSASGGFHSHLRSWLAFASLPLLALAAVIVWVKTDQGTLKIESAVDGIAVEVVDKNNHAKQLSIKEGENETVLYAGQYRIRLAGKHDGLELDHDMITLRRGEELVANITTTPHSEPISESSGISSAATERLYEGRSESDWQRQFRLETEPLAKLDAASALLSLGSVLPPADQLQRTLDVGEEIVRVSSNDPLVDYAFQFGLGSPFQGKSLVTVPGLGVGSQHHRVQRFQNSLNQLFEKVPASVRVAGLSPALLHGNDARTAVASALLRSSIPIITKDASAKRALLTALDVPLDSTDRSALCQSVRLLFMSVTSSATSDERGDLENLWNRLAQRVLTAPVEKSPSSAFRNQLRNDLHMKANALQTNGPAAISHETAARLILSEIIEFPYTVQTRFAPPQPGMGGMGGGGFGGMGMGGGMAPMPIGSLYKPERVAAARKYLAYFLDAWVKVANEYLEQHRDAPTSRSVQTVVRSLDPVLSLYSDGDDWAVDQTAQLLTSLLPAYVTDADQLLADLKKGQSLGTTPAVLLTQIVRITGHLPPSLSQGIPQSPEVAKKLAEFRAILTRRQPWKANRFEAASDHLFLLAPWETLQAVLASPTAQKLSEPGTEFTTGELIDEVAKASHPNHAMSDALPVDSLLLLTMLADLTGLSAEQDARIANLFNGWRIQHVFDEQLKTLLDSSLKLRAFAVQALKTIAAKSKDKALANAAQQLLFAAGSGPADSPFSAHLPTPTPANPDVPERLYQGRAESEWKRQFHWETEPIAKLNAANALLAIASAFPPNEQLERILDVGEEIVRVGYGEPELGFALSDGSNPPISARNWPLGQGGDLYHAYQKFQANLNQSVRRIPPIEAATVLTQAVIDSNSARTAFAGSLLDYALRQQIQNSDEATQIVLTKFATPLTGIDRSALVRLLRLQYSEKATGEHRQEVLTELRELALALRDAPAGLSQQLFISRLIGNAKELYRADWPIELSEAMARLVLHQLTAQSVRVESFFPTNLSVTDSSSPYGKEYVRTMRREMAPYLAAWVTVVNEYLELHRREQLAWSANPIFQSLDVVLRVYSDGDDWPVDKTAELLTEILRRHYSGDSEKSDKRSPRRLLPATPAMLLTQIIRLTGRVPDYVRTMQPRSAEVVNELNRFEEFLKTRSPGNYKLSEMIQGLKDFSPDQLIRLSLQHELKPSGYETITLEKRSIQSNGDLIVALLRLKTEPIDPLLMLTLLADLTGTDAAQDARIATTFVDDFRGSLSDLLNGSLKARQFARESLESIVVKSKSDALTTAVRNLLPTK